MVGKDQFFGQKPIAQWLLEGILGALLVSFLVAVLNLSGEVGGLKAEFKGMKERQDRIAAALPDIRVQIAEEQLHRPLEIAIVTAKPIEVAPKSWRTDLRIFNPSSGSVARILVELPSRDDRRVAEIIEGTLAEQEQQSISFKEIEILSKEVKAGNSIIVFPDSIDKKASFAVFASSPLSSNYLKRLEERLGRTAVVTRENFQMECSDSLGKLVGSLKYEPAPTVTPTPQRWRSDTQLANPDSVSKTWSLEYKPKPKPTASPHPDDRL